MLEQHEKMIIFSVEKEHLTDLENTRRARVMRLLLLDAGIPFKKVIGRYEGDEEKGFLIQETYAEQFHYDIFTLYEQDCYLELDVDREAFLVFPDGSKQSIGYFQETDKLVAMSRSGYTYDPETERYYVCNETFTR